MITVDEHEGVRVLDVVRNHGLLQLRILLHIPLQDNNL